nr:queuosine precursor transporter [Nakamurella antarctica]
MTKPISNFIEPAVVSSRSVYHIVVAAFCALLLISNVSAVKLIDFGGPFITDGGALLFPLTYVLGDVLAEVYGLRAARRTILLGFAISLTATLSFYLVQMTPAQSDWGLQDSYENILGFVWRIVLASMCGYLVGQFLNAFVMVKLKERFGTGRLWVRLIGSTIVGEAADTMVFCTVAFAGVLSASDLWSYITVGFLWKVGIETVMLPVTYRVIKYVKKREAIQDVVPISAR